jgi:hypothetical protein
MNKQNIIRTISLGLLIISVSLAPFLGIGILFGLAGSNQSHFILIALGYLGVIVFSLLSVLSQKFFPIIFVSILIVVTGLVLDQQFWSEHNSDLCAELRSDPSCVEDACGFSCENFRGGEVGMVVPASICPDKPVDSCANQINSDTKTQKQEQTSNENILNKFSEIVSKIINSSNPESLDYEKERVAIYNCFKINNIDGEWNSSNKLKLMNLSVEQLNKYYDYLAVHGQNVNRQAPRPIAALPGGDPNLSCDYLGL